jgi:hypothetical protein
MRIWKFCTFGHWWKCPQLCPRPWLVRSCSRCFALPGFGCACWWPSPSGSPLVVSWCWNGLLWTTLIPILWLCDLVPLRGPRTSEGAQRSPHAACAPEGLRVYTDPQPAPRARERNSESAWDVCFMQTFSLQKHYYGKRILRNICVVCKVLLMSDKS